LLNIYCGLYLEFLCKNYVTTQEKKNEDKNPHQQIFPKIVHRVLLTKFLINLPVIIFACLIQQKGTVDVTSYLHKIGTTEPYVGVKASVLIWFLNHCYSTPLYSHIHANVSVRLMKCTPNLDLQPGYKVEDKIFYENPIKWIDSELNKGTEYQPTHIVISETLYKKLMPNFDTLHFGVCFKTYNYHFFMKYFHPFMHETSHDSQYLFVLCKK